MNSGWHGWAMMGEANDEAPHHAMAGFFALFLDLRAIGFYPVSFEPAEFRRYDNDEDLVKAWVRVEATGEWGALA